jgi:uncharacterized SAM-binding protein YcdF (DUF218 family)
MWIVSSKFLAYLLSPLSLVLILFLFGATAAILGGRRLSRFLLATGIILIMVSSSPIVATALVTSLEHQYPPTPVSNTVNSKLIVVLGGALAMPLKPRLEAELVDSSDRILHAFRLFQAGKAPVIYVSAGNLTKTDNELPEASYISQLLMEWGIPGHVIIKGGSSRTTRENAAETRAYLEQNSLLDEPVLLVTSALHMPRAVKTFEKAGIRVIPSVTDVSAGGTPVPGILKWLPSLGALNQVTKSWHEYLGTWMYRLRGWV